MKTILVDVDEVLRDMVNEVLKIYNSFYGTSFTKNDITEYDMRTVLTEIKDIKQYFCEFAKEVFLNSKSFKNSSKAVQDIKDLGYHIRIVTKQFRGTELYTLGWLLKHNINYDSVVFTDDKSWVKGDIIVDDCIDHIKSSKCKTKFLMKRPWNKKYWNEYQTVSSMTEVFKILKNKNGK